MPIKVTDNRAESEIAWLCDDEWALDVQLECFQSWLAETAEILTPGSFSADIGYSVKEGATGGGAGLTTDTIQTMANLGVELYFSEYSAFSD